MEDHDCLVVGGLIIAFALVRGGVGGGLEKVFQVWDAEDAEMAELLTDFRSLVGELLAVKKFGAAGRGYESAVALNGVSGR